MGIPFGLGVGVARLRQERIDGAEIAADGTIRISQRRRSEPRVVLEAHSYGLWCNVSDCTKATRGVGPFFGLAATGNAIEAFALGVMVAWKDKGTNSATGFSVGIGVVLDTKVQVLANGFEEGKPLPTGETQIKFETKTMWSPLLVFSRAF